MKALVKMEITLYDNKGHAIAHDNTEREYQTESVYSTLCSARQHIEELRFGWMAVVDNNIY